MLNLKKLLTKILKNMIPTKAQVTASDLTINEGALDSFWYNRVGRVVTIRVAAHKTTAVSSGSNVFRCQIPDNLRPMNTSAYGVGYYGGAAVVMHIAQGGELIIRACGGSINANGQVWVGATYITHQ